nr:hypothetical protein [Pseudomonas sp. Hg5Tf]MDH2559789.1 hypothetical protein [Pseudomonas sp. Hg5Tf]
MSDSFKHTLAHIKQAKKEAGGKNYLGSSDVAKLILEPMLYPLIGSRSSPTALQSTVHVISGQALLLSV